MQAIAGHDHLSPIQSTGLLADMLKLADAIAILDAYAGREVSLRLGDRKGMDLVNECLKDKLFLGEMIDGLSARHDVDLGTVSDALNHLPVQNSPTS